MGKVIKGPDKWWNRNKPTEPEEKSEQELKEKSTSSIVSYPWHTLTAPPGTSDEEYRDEVAFLQRLVNLAGDSGAILKLPEGWFWDPKKNQKLIDQLLRIAEMTDEDSSEDSNEIPDDIA